MDDIKKNKEENLTNVILNANTILTKSYLSQMNKAQIIDSNIKFSNTDE